mgnify:CR=1 FL=1
MERSNNMVGWFELPVTNIDRAKAFYETVFNISIQIMDFGGFLMGWFPSAENKPGAAGTLVKHEMYEPSSSAGVLVYFSCDDVSQELSRVAAAGGKVLQQKTQISPEYGYMALFVDSEGNRVALHSMK